MHMGCRGTWGGAWRGPHGKGPLLHDSLLFDAVMRMKILSGTINFLVRVAGGLGRWVGARVRV